MGGTKPTRSRTPLDELLADPLIRLVMRADGVDSAELERLFSHVRKSRLADGGGDEAGRSPPESAIFPDEDRRYRSGVGIMLLNPRNEVFVGRRIRGPDVAWQMPQGGIKSGELPHMAALRELREEVGTDNVEILAESRGWLRYDLPADLIGKVWGGRWRGQQQNWFAVRFLGSDSDINLATEEPEFSAWRWVPVTALPGLIVDFKRQVYLEVLQEFRELQTPGDRQQGTER